jgi:hypothetical protein
MSAFGGKADMKIVTAPSANPGIVRSCYALIFSGSRRFNSLIEPITCRLNQGKLPLFFSHAVSRQRQRLYFLSRLNSICKKSQ